MSAARLLIMVLRQFLPPSAERTNKDQHSRLTLFLDWLVQFGDQFPTNPLAAYSAYLQHERGFAPTSVKAHLASVRGYIKALLPQDRLQAALYQLTDAALPPAERQTQAQNALGQLLIALQPAAAPTPIITVSPRNRHLTDADINALFATLKLDSPFALRDAAGITLMIVTGVRESELCKVDVADLRHWVGNRLALHVPPGTGCVERYIPYREGEWVLQLVDTWLAYHQITTGPVFRGFYKSGNLLRPTRLSARAVEKLLTHYPIWLDNEAVVLKPLDLRHAYAAHLYRQDVDLDTIRDNLGLKQTQTAWSYIGSHSDREYQPYYFDLTPLSQWQQPPE